MRSFCVLLFALVAFASAADDDVTQGPNDVEVCEDNQDVCDDLIGNLMCQLPSAGDWCPIRCQKGCGAPAGSARKREMQELEEYREKKIRAARAYQTDCRDDDRSCCNAYEVCNVISKDYSRTMCKKNPNQCCKKCTEFYGPKSQWKKDQLLSLLARLLEK